MKEYLDATVPELAFGEFWDTCEYTDGVLNYNQDSHRQRTVNWCDRTGGTSAAFDFTTKGALHVPTAPDSICLQAKSSSLIPLYPSQWFLGRQATKIPGNSEYRRQSARPLQLRWQMQDNECLAAWPSTGRSQVVA